MKAAKSASIARCHAELSPLPVKKMQQSSIIVMRMADWSNGGIYPWLCISNLRRLKNHDLSVFIFSVKISLFEVEFDLCHYWLSTNHIRQSCVLYFTY